MSEFSALLHRVYVGAKVTDHPADDDYLQLHDDFVASKSGIADRVADEIQLLKQQGEHDLAREMIVALVHDELSEKPLNDDDIRAMQEKIAASIDFGTTPIYNSRV